MLTRADFNVLRVKFLAGTKGGDLSLYSNRIPICHNVSQRDDHCANVPKHVDQLEGTLHQILLHWHTTCHVWTGRVWISSVTAAEGNKPKREYRTEKKRRRRDERLWVCLGGLPLPLVCHNQNMAFFMWKFPESTKTFRLGACEAPFAPLVLLELRLFAAPIFF